MSEDKPIIKDTMGDDETRLISKKTSVVMKKIGLVRERKNGKRKLLEVLGDSNSKLTENLNVLKSFNNCKKEKEQAHTVSMLVQEMECIDEQIKTERAFLADLQNQISQVSLQQLTIENNNAEITKQSRVTIKNNKKIDKSREILNEKIYVESVHLSNDLTKNSELKEKIRVMMSERKNFNKEYNNLLEKLKKGKVVMQDLSDTLNHAISMRQNIVQKLEQINVKEKKQKALQEQEAVDLTMRYDNELETRDFMLTKTAPRRNSVIVRKMNRLSMNKSTLYNQSLKRLRILLTNLLDKYNLKGTVDSDSDDIYKVNDLVKGIEKENNEFTSLFTYVTNLAHELEVIKERVCEKEKEIEELSEEQLEREMVLVDNIKYLESFKTNLDEVKANLLDDILSNRRDLDKLYKGIETLINICKADVTPLLALLGNNDNITDRNYKLFLEALETRLVELMKLLKSGSFILSNKQQQGEITSDTMARLQGDDAVEDKIIITKPCELCFPPIKRGSLAISLDQTISLKDVAKVTFKKV